MKQPRKLKRNEKIFLDKKGLKPDNWMVKSEDIMSITFIHKVSGNTKKFEKPL